MATMNVSLSQEFADFVASQIDSGEYGTASEVVRDALRLLRREKAAHDEKIAILKREIEIGFAQARSGRVVKRSAAEVAAALDLEDDHSP